MATYEPLDSGPVVRSDRIVLWDLLRGVAVLGVLLANMPYMSLARMMVAHHEPLDPAASAPDVAAFWFVRVFADTKFITLFSVLFGAGLGLLAEKARERETPFVGNYIRRLAALWVFGVLHGVFIWFGDILAHYAVTGFIAMWFRGLSVRTLLLTAGSLLLVWLQLMVLFSVVPGWFNAAPPGALVEQFREVREVMSSGDFGAMAAYRGTVFTKFQLFMPIFWGGRTLALFLVGIALVKSGILRDPAAYRAFFVRCVKIGLPVGILFQVLWSAPGAAPHGTSARMTAAVGMYMCALFLTPAYAGLIALWSLSDTGAWLRDRLAAVGQMAFTNYIMHSVITGIVFNYAGQFDHWGRAAGLGLTFVIFAFQLLISRPWLDRYRFGPLEWLWRSLTYFRLQPLRRPEVA